MGGDMKKVKLLGLPTKRKARGQVVVEIVKGSWTKEKATVAPAAATQTCKEINAELEGALFEVNVVAGQIRLLQDQLLIARVCIDNLQAKYAHTDNAVDVWLVGCYVCCDLLCDSNLLKMFLTFSEECEAMSARCVETLCAVSSWRC